MTKKYFGTDGIRGRANQFPMTADMALKIAMAVSLVVNEQKAGPKQNRVVIGKDTRLSCYMLEQAMAAGFEAMGMDVIFLGPLPTPAVAMLTRSMRADIGVMISASHNPYHDNGIKLFGPDGYKLPNNMEAGIEAKLSESDLNQYLPDSPSALGRASRLEDASGRYVEYLKSAFPRFEGLNGMKVAVDCAHGAGYKVGPQLLWELEADVVSIGNKPNGRNINDGYGATATHNLQDAVKEHEADIGIALDGDGDRLILVDETGAVVDGDQILAMLGSDMKNRGRLIQNTVVATVMSNLGLERYLDQNDMTLARTKVGDRHVSALMQDKGYNLGGEQSGHIILSDYSTTGDGLLAALQILSCLKREAQPASKALQKFTPLPQILQNVRFNAQAKVIPLDEQAVVDKIKETEDKLKASGRLLVRKSGTEPLIRVMAEGDDLDFITATVSDLCAVIEKYSKAG